MTKFDTFYDKQCAKIWNLPSIENPTYRINKPSWKGGKFSVMQVHVGWAIGVGKSFATLAEAEQFIKELTS
jgi:K+-sensing histidine kinase KdpD